MSIWAPEPQFLHLGNGTVIAQDCARAKWVKLNTWFAGEGWCCKGGGGSVLYPIKVRLLRTATRSASASSRWDTSPAGLLPSLCSALLLNLSARVAWGCRPSPGPLALCLSSVCWARIQTQILCISSQTCLGWAAFSGGPSSRYKPPVVLMAIFSQKQDPLGPKGPPCSPASGKPFSSLWVSAFSSAQWVLRWSWSPYSDSGTMNFFFFFWLHGVAWGNLNSQMRHLTES